MVFDGGHPQHPTDGYEQHRRPRPEEYFEYYNYNDNFDSLHEQQYEETVYFGQYSHSSLREYVGQPMIQLMQGSRRAVQHYTQDHPQFSLSVLVALLSIIIFNVARRRKQERGRPSLPPYADGGERFPIMDSYLEEPCRLGVVQFGLLRQWAGYIFREVSVIFMTLWLYLAWTAEAAARLRFVVCGANGNELSATTSLPRRRRRRGLIMMSRRESAVLPELEDVSYQVNNGMKGAGLARKANIVPDSWGQKNVEEILATESESKSDASMTLESDSKANGERQECVNALVEEKESDIEPSFISDRAYPKGWLVYDRHHGVVAKESLDKQRRQRKWRRAMEEKKEDEYEYGETGTATPERDVLSCDERARIGGIDSTPSVPLCASTISQPSALPHQGIAVG